MLALLLIAAFCATGIVLYLNERSSRAQEQVAGAETGRDYLQIDVTVQKVDATGLVLTAGVLVEAQGALAADGNPLVPAAALKVETTSLQRAADLNYPAGQRIGLDSVPFSLTGGPVSDYPFDGYESLIGFQATAAGKPVPVVVFVQDADPFFVTRVKSEQVVDEGAVLVNERVTRSRSTFILAWFMMAAMWALALSVFLAGWLIVSQRRGLLWPSLGWMAATLFALVGMRNAAPGSPPIGSLLDYAAFFWAEAIIAVTLTTVVVRGAQVEGEKADPG
ncbi:DUF4436 family protein [Kitasatospora mediocidica]|uniref:DUF4436 family protein n=1 Tax=Kitasatospora mediocidica TaxID=58352 RepID=UPI00055E9D32|nr:DUF4436 family protein [Kitasatospora mediocidica]